MDKLFVIFNPAARGEKSKRLRQFLEAKASADITIAPTQCAGDAKLLAARAVTEGYSMIVAAGGDGTINEVINGLGTSGIPLGGFAARHGQRLRTGTRHPAPHRRRVGVD